MALVQEFKAFISRGNVMDMAVGIIVGAAFTGIVSSLVADLINPILGLIVGGIDFTDLAVTFGEGETAATLAYGRFIMAVINFLIIAWVVFLLVKLVNRIKDGLTQKTKDDEPDPADAAELPAPTETEILAEIRDLLKARAAPGPQTGA
ncbi:large-conductance mechanosensitive channel protein MscL [Mangrovicoccus algicola]|uniref:Large-conductance mechanosensitive channel n=1 Tax=Mangrovicoccus algicola TaxID=2771008 RepID=A0A8J6YX00_9RHOB|nr:large-conductance mechanosensitive channel protein MscL [Mangrovicoccus algicola]MBE3639272.1 large-conductance mechanosensitive channel protein MscL [Mangrovicoccus algicola]